MYVFRKIWAKYSVTEGHQRMRLFGIDTKGKIVANQFEDIEQNANVAVRRVQVQRPSTETYCSFTSTVSVSLHRKILSVVAACP